MSHHKRKKAKKSRAGCMMCKPHKHNGRKGSFEHQTWQEKKARIREKEQKKEIERD